jgi:hypothetical protein
VSGALKKRKTKSDGRHGILCAHMRRTSALEFKVIGRVKATGSLVFGVFAKREIMCKGLIWGTEFVGPVGYRNDLGGCNAFHMRELRQYGEEDTAKEDGAKKKKRKTSKLVVCDGSNTLWTGHLGAYINTHVGLVYASGRDMKANVKPPTTVGRAHTAIKRINKGEELLVSYGSEHKRILGHVKWREGVEWYEARSALAVQDKLVQRPAARRRTHK